MEITEKNRYPHDHNRDYTSTPIYSSVKALKTYVKKFGCHYGFDFHAPGHWKGEFDYIYIIRNDKPERIDRFSKLLIEEHIPGGMTYSAEFNREYNHSLNGTGTDFSSYINHLPENKMAFALEVTYAGTEKNKVSQQGLKTFGVSFTKAFARFIEEHNSSAAL